MQSVNAYLAVRDVAAALAYYERAFGFNRRLVMPGPDGNLMHAEVTHRDSVIMLGPESEAEKAAASATPRTSLYVYVPDVDRVTAQARDAGGRVLHEPKDQFWGDRTATVVDADGHHWTLATFKKLIPPDQMKPSM
jgi:PhnB protein